MRFYGKAVAFITALAALTGSIGTVGIAEESNETAEIRGFNENFENVTGIGGFAGSLGGSVKIEESSAGNKYISVCPVIDGINAFIQRQVSTGSKVNLETGFKYMQNGKKTDGACVFSLQNSGKDIIRLETQDGNIIMKKAYSDNIFTIVENYSANKWYEFRIIVDFINGTATVSVDNQTKVDEAEFLVSVTSADTFYMGTPYSPGFCVDDIYLVPLQTVQSISISGDTAPAVKEDGALEYTYTSAVYDTDNVAVKGATRFYLSPSDDESAVMTSDGDNAVISFTGDAAGKTFTLTASAGEMSETITINPSGYTPVVSEIKITGDPKISSRTSRLYRYKFDTACYDQHGAAMEDEECTFKLVNGDTNVPQTVTVDAETGEITVSGEVPKDKYIYLIATSVTNPDKSARKRITMLDAETYASDASRFQVLLDYVENVWNIGSDPNGTPLIADIYDRYTKKLGEWRSGTSAGFATTSNLAYKGGWYRTLDGLSTITGDEKYAQSTTDTYQYYVDNYIEEVSGLPIWGGHAAVNLETGSPYYVYDAKYHELKEAGVYMEPFFKIDPKTGSQITKNIVDSHVSNWDWLRFNRHGKYQSEVHPKDEAGSWDDWKAWTTDALDQKNGVGMPLITSEISFRSAGQDLAYSLSTMAKYADNEENRQAARAWAHNILQTYYRLENPDTYFGGDMASSFGIDTYDEFMELNGEWYLPQNYDSQSLKGSCDRWYRQYADDLVDQGFMTEENKWQAQECFVQRGMPNTLLELYTARNLGFDTEEGSHILERAVGKLAKFIDLAYYPETNEYISYLGWDGTSFEGFISKRAGYFGGKEDYMRAFGRTTPGSNSPFNAVTAYLYSAGKPELESYRRSIYAFLRNVLKANGMGDIGENYPGDNMQLNFETDMSDGFYALTFCLLYQSTGIVDYLDMARHIADNVIDTKLVDGLFYINTSNVYIPLGGHKAERCHTMLLILEATIRGEADLIEPFMPYGGYFEDRTYDEIEKGIYVSSQSDVKDSSYWFAYYNEGVKAQELIVPETDITLTVGETKKLEVSALPTDASYSLCFDVKDPENIMFNYDTKSIIGVKPGTTEVVITNTDKTVKTVIKVTVE